MTPRSLLAWTLYGIGHLVSRPMVRWDCAAWLDSIYQPVMRWSSAIQGDGPGPWLYATAPKED